jgi:hypothetical protein
MKGWAAEGNIRQILPGCNGESFVTVITYDGVLFLPTFGLIASKQHFYYMGLAAGFQPVFFIPLPFYFCR